MILFVTVGCPTVRGSYGLRRPLLLLLSFTAILWISPGHVFAKEILFLQDGHTIQAEQTESIGGDRIRVWKPAGVIDLPRSKVFSIHRMDPPTASPNSAPPAEMYRDLTQQMTDQVRREIQEQSGTFRSK